MNMDSCQYHQLSKTTHPPPSTDGHDFFSETSTLASNYDDEDSDDDLDEGSDLDDGFDSDHDLESNNDGTGCHCDEIAFNCLHIPGRGRRCGTSCGAFAAIVNDAVPALWVYCDRASFDVVADPKDCSGGGGGGGACTDLSTRLALSGGDGPVRRRDGKGVEAVSLSHTHQTLLTSATPIHRGGRSAPCSRHERRGLGPS